MKNRPIKFRMFELINEKGSVWNYEIVKQLQSEYDMNTDYGRDCLNFDLIEMHAAGFLEEEEIVLDTEGKFRKGRLLSRYKLTELGKGQLQNLIENIGGK